jgi:hypothetical protein
MRPEAKNYILKEYGSWSVLTIAYLIGLGVCRSFAWTSVPLYISLGLLINSKQAFMKWLRTTTDKRSFLIFLGQVIIATVILAAIFQNDILRLLPLLVFPMAYLLMSKLAGEHFVLTEVLGFTLLSLAAVLAKFLLTNGLDVRLFVGVVLYFSAGVFKIKAVLLNKTRDCILTALSVVFTAFVYRRMHIPIIILFPLVDNLFFAATLYRVRLQTTGWIEVAKSLSFLGLFLFWY